MSVCISLTSLGFGAFEGRKSAGIFAWFKKLLLLINFWQSRTWLRLRLFGDKAAISSGLGLISSLISISLLLLNKTRMVSWLPPILDEVFYSRSKLSIAPWIIDEQLMFSGTGTLQGPAKLMSCWVWHKVYLRSSSFVLHNENSSVYVIFNLVELFDSLQ